MHDGFSWSKLCSDAPPNGDALLSGDHLRRNLSLLNADKPIFTLHLPPPGTVRIERAKVPIRAVSLAVVDQAIRTR
jgi:hypothetical protein